MLDTIEKPVEGKVTEPSRAWENVFTSDVTCLDVDGKLVRDGSVMHDPRLWPTHEIACEKAREAVAECAANRTPVTWLGAFPVTP